MSATTVAYNNLYSESWNNVYSLINNKTNVADPATVSGESRKWVYTRAPDVKDLSFTGFPYIVVNPSSIDESRAQSLSGKSGVVNFVIDVEVITCDRDVGNRNDRGASDNDNISNDVIETFNNVTNKNTLRGNGLAFSRVTSSSVDVEEFNNTLVYRRVLTLGFSSRKRLSA